MSIAILRNIGIHEWNEDGIPRVETLTRLRLWDYLDEEAKAEITVLSAVDSHRGRG